MRLFESWVCNECCNTPTTSKKAILMMQRIQTMSTEQLQRSMSRINVVVEEEEEEDVSFRCNALTNTAMSAGTIKYSTSINSIFNKAVKLDNGNELSVDDAMEGIN